MLNVVGLNTMRQPNSTCPASSSDLLLNVGPRYLVQHFIPIAFTQADRKADNIVFIEEAINFKSNVIPIGSEKNHAVNVMITTSVISQFSKFLVVFLGRR